MSTATAETTAEPRAQEKLFDKEVIVAEHHRLRITREILDEDVECITGIIPRGALFGDWATEDTAGPINPTREEVLRDVSAALGFAVVFNDYDDGIEEDDSGALLLHFERAEQPKPQPADGEIAALRKQVANLTLRLEQADLRDKGWHRRGAHLSKLFATMQAHRKQYMASKAKYEEEVAAAVDDMTEHSPLFDHMERAAKENASQASANGQASAAATPPPADDPRNNPDPIDVLKGFGATDAVLKKLRDADIKTLGDLVRFQEAKGLEGFSAPLTTIKGIKGATLEKLDNACQAYWAKKGQTIKQAVKEVVNRVAEGTNLPAGAPKVETPEQLRQAAEAQEQQGSRDPEKPADPKRGKKARKRKVK